jgi:hypothetical protein
MNEKQTKADKERQRQSDVWCRLRKRKHERRREGEKGERNSKERLYVEMI